MVKKKTESPRASGNGRRRKKPVTPSIDLSPAELSAAAPSQAVSELYETIESDRGKVLSVYREPYGGHWLIMAALPVDQVEATPFQRNLSENHVRKLETVIAKIGRFLDPIIAVRAEPRQTARYWTPNGYHRLSAMKTLGAKSIMAIVVPEAATAYQILALNTEKAHNLREKALEVVRMYKELARLDNVPEETYALEFEEAAHITLGFCYEERPRFSGGAYHPILKRVDGFLRKPLHEAIEIRRARSGRLMELDDIVIRNVQILKDRGLTSPYLKTFVVARINPLRFRSKEKTAPGFDEMLDRMAKSAAGFNPDKIQMTDLAHAGGAPEAEE